MLDFIGKKGISHRGLRRDGLIENTLEAFALARKHGFRHMETDLRCSADGVIFLSHDENLARLGGGQGIIHQSSSQELAKLKLGNGSRLARFEDLVQKFGECRFILDIKAESGWQTIQSLLKWAKYKNGEEWLRNQARFLFWRRDQEEFLRQSLSGLTFLARELACWRAGLCCLAGLPWLGQIQANSTYAVPYKLHGRVILNQAMIRRYHQRKARVIAYLPPIDAKILTEIHEAGADELLLDDLP